MTDHNWEAYTETGRERSGKDVVEWILEAVDLGVGEVLVTSVDRDGTKKGFDIDLLKTVSDICSDIPLIVSGGCGSPDDALTALHQANIDGIGIATGLHYNLFSIADIKACLQEKGIGVRKT